MVMLAQLVNNNRSSIGQQCDDNDEEFPSAPASLPSVPSFGTEEWRHFRFNALMDASTTSASPMSSCFPGFASSGSSAVGTNSVTHRGTESANLLLQGIARSYSTTPLSSTSVEIPRSSGPLLLKTSSHVQLAELSSKKHTKFVFEDPSMVKPKKDKTMRACTPCFTKRLEVCYPLSLHDNSA